MLSSSFSWACRCSSCSSCCRMLSSSSRTFSRVMLLMISSHSFTSPSSFAPRLAAGPCCRSASLSPRSSFSIATPRVSRSLILTLGEILNRKKPPPDEGLVLPPPFTGSGWPLTASRLLGGRSLVGDASLLPPAPSGAVGFLRPLKNSDTFSMMLLRRSRSLPRLVAAPRTRTSLSGSVAPLSVSVRLFCVVTSVSSGESESGSCVAAATATSGGSISPAIGVCSASVSLSGGRGSPRLRWVGFDGTALRCASSTNGRFLSVSSLCSCSESNRKPPVRCETKLERDGAVPVVVAALTSATGSSGLAGGVGVLARSSCSSSSSCSSAGTTCSSADGLRSSCSGCSGALSTTVLMLSWFISACSSWAAICVSGGSRSISFRSSGSPMYRPSMIIRLSICISSPVASRTSSRGTNRSSPCCVSGLVVESSMKCGMSSTLDVLLLVLLLELLELLMPLLFEPDSEMLSDSISSCLVQGTSSGTCSVVSWHPSSCSLSSSTALCCSFGACCSAELPFAVCSILLSLLSFRALPDAASGTAVDVGLTCTAAAGLSSFWHSVMFEWNVLNLESSAEAEPDLRMPSPVVPSPSRYFFFSSRLFLDAMPSSPGRGTASGARFCTSLIVGSTSTSGLNSRWNDGGTRCGCSSSNSESVDISVEFTSELEAPWGSRTKMETVY
uniref:Uncharacterized protein n=1 Tax=Anopheles coluzzii TaxID=1518534 RepID=A0A8W7P015_ANOCL